MSKSAMFTLPFFFAALTTAASAQETTALFYFGAGSNNEDEVIVIDDTPFVVGLLGRPGNGPMILGFDIAGEGEMLDSTYGGNEVRQAISFNFLVGGSLVNTGDFRVDGSVLLGMRESFVDCPDSFLGYQCYADQEPETEYDLNLGAMMNFTFQNVSVGVRVTEVSTQAVLGFAF